MKKIIEKYWLDLPMSQIKNQEIKRKQVEKLVEYYLYAKEHFAQIIAIEEPFSHIDDNMIIKGKVDLVAKLKDGKVAIIDFKARKQKGIEKTNVDKQLQIYAYCLENKYPVEKLIAFTFEDLKETEFKLNKQETKKLLDEMSKKMKDENFHKQKGDFCPQCQFNFYCW
jgi:CRISPR/Cas system-associated exonuclease Cas4 (RecB family)